MWPFSDATNNVHNEQIVNILKEHSQYKLLLIIIIIVLVIIFIIYRSIKYFQKRTIEKSRNNFPL